MRIALLDDVICAKHIVRDVLMMSKTSDHAQFPGHAFVSLMHMGWHPASSPRLVSEILLILATQKKGDRSRFLPLFRKRLTDPVDYVRYWAVAAVGEIGTSRCGLGFAP